MHLRQAWRAGRGTRPWGRFSSPSRDCRRSCSPWPSSWSCASGCWSPWALPRPTPSTRTPTSMRWAWAGCRWRSLSRC
ncbi:hypothetical protein StrepF001_38875 [Streptomyces sp. F001]|nr:hypothetical protein StrepF001_38875 [Streptomyces sp. F001]